MKNNRAELPAIRFREEKSETKNCLKCSKDCRFHFLRGRDRCKTLKRFSVASDQKLSEVPFDPPAQSAGQFILKVTEHRVRCFAVNLHFPEHRKAHTVVDVASLRDFIGAAGFLFTELVAGETQYDKPRVAYFL